jgi:hypothetical protein
MLEMCADGGGRSSAREIVPFVEPTDRDVLALIAGGAVVPT